MDSNSAKEFSSFVTPDGLRKTLQLSKNLYDSYTKRNYGYEDINGSQYVGTVENFGSEILIESRKMLMDKPSLRNIFVDNTFDFYFNIEYSGLINTYDQQYMLVALLEKDVLLSNKEYRVEFHDCVDKYIIRSESWGSYDRPTPPKVYGDKFVHTQEPPVLIIKDLSTNEETRQSLFVKTGNDVPTDYYFFINPTTEDLIDSYDTGSKTLLTVPITDKMYGLPFVWICVDIFRLYPSIMIDNGVDMMGRELLTPGTDGHGVTHLYPLAHGEDNVPSDMSMNEGEWYLKIQSKTPDVFIDNSKYTQNHSVPISSITYLFTNDIFSEPIFERKLTFNQEYIRVFLDKAVEWHFRKPVQGDYDYDGMTYENNAYAFIPLSIFKDNYPPEEYHSNVYVPAFRIEFDPAYLHRYEGICENAVSGIHVDSSSDYTDNSVSKKNGVIYDMGDFDGLPPYFKTLLSRDIQRSRVELYSIRDDLNNVNQKVTDKQVSGLIVDSAIPQTEIIGALQSMKSVIKYNTLVGRRYEVVGDVVSIGNSMSDIIFYDENTFGDCNIVKYSNKTRFIYHGSRTFSLGLMGLDPYLEKGRVYCISNDDAKYENNGSTKYKKANRCMCRVCDIPTEFGQLINIIDLSPTIIIEDVYNTYNRTGTNCELVDQERLWNGYTDPHVFMNNNMHVFMFGDSIENSWSESNTDIYKNTDNLNETIDLSRPEGSKHIYEFSITEQGVDYAIDDKFKFIIGGLCFHGTVTNSNESGNVTGISIDDNDKATAINIANIGNRISRYVTTGELGNGYGLVISLTIKDSYWNSIQRTKTSYFDNIIAFQFDEFNNIWINRLSDDGVNWDKNVLQLTGTPIVDNPYDEKESMTLRSTQDVIIRNTLMTSNEFDSVAWEDPSMLSKEYSIPSGIPESASREDILHMLSQMADQQDTLYMLIPSEEYEDFNLVAFEICPVSYSGISENILPRFNLMNLSSYYNKICSLAVSWNDYSLYEQPAVFVYNPIKSKIQELDDVITHNYRTIYREHDMTFRDIMRDYINDDNTLQYDVYSYDETRFSDEYEEFKNRVMHASKDELLSIIISKYGNDVLPIRMENTNYRYTKEMLIDFLLQNWYDNPIYKKADIKLMRYSSPDDPVIATNGSPIGEQPKGGYENISVDISNLHMKVDNMPFSASILFIFKLDYDSSIEDLNDFRIKDENGVDISPYSLLIYNYQKYVFKNERWVKVI